MEGEMPKIERIIEWEIMRLAKGQVRTVFFPFKREVWQMSMKLSGLSKSRGFFEPSGKGVTARRSQAVFE